ncbi:hypothetical protein VTK73DRAFT_8785 [Phialemonium thermophilum]|uniref:Uncharacterized protein n=1 Tax=Phialemonium thermophilum TaxID=223376 RepID=A0ABR3XP92_9PEZI
MASGRVFDPLVLLRVAPVISSSFSLWHCVSQHLFLNNLIVPEHRNKGNDILPSYWRTFFQPGLGVIFSLYGLSAGFALANLYSANSPGAVSRWYKFGVLFTAAHFTFVPAVAKVIKSIVDGDGKEDTWKFQKKWLKIHAVRSVLVDFSGWLCFLAAATESLTVV